MLYGKMNLGLLVSAAIFSAACSGGSKKTAMGTYAYDRAFFAERGIETLELTSEDGASRVLVIPAYQGRVMTSSAAGDTGDSYGWINYKFIEKGELNPRFNPVGGEERFWIGPEGGPNSFYFKKGDEQVYANWKVPAAIDTDTYDIRSQSGSSVCFTREFALRSASDRVFRIGVERTIELVDREGAEQTLGTEIPGDVKFVAYRTNNVITNRGDESWTRDSGMPSVWLLGMFNPTPTTTVFIPYNRDFAGRIVNDEYFGKIPSDRLIVEEGMIYFKIDGLWRSKLGLPAGSARDICGSYDSEKGVLTVVKYALPDGEVDYVNGQWGPQDNPYGGDVINAYNDGPTDDGTVMGPFYEIETSSPGAALAPGQSLAHEQYTMHFQGDEASIGAIVRAIFGVDLNRISTMFR